MTFICINANVTNYWNAVALSSNSKSEPDVRFSARPLAGRHSAALLPLKSTTVGACLYRIGLAGAVRGGICSTGRLKCAPAIKGNADVYGVARSIRARSVSAPGKSISKLTTLIALCVSIPLKEENACCGLVKFLESSAFASKHALVDADDSTPVASVVERRRSTNLLPLILVAGASPPPC